MTDTRQIKYPDADGVLSTTVVRVTRSHSKRFVAPDDLRTVDLGTLPQFEHLDSRGVTRYAVTAAYVEHTWDGKRWFTNRLMTGVKLTKAGTAWGGFPRAHGILFHKGDAIPAAVEQHWDAYPTPTADLTVTEQA